MYEDLDKVNSAQRTLHKLYGSEEDPNKSALSGNAPPTSRDKNGYSRLVRGEYQFYDLYRNRKTGKFVSKSTYEKDQADYVAWLESQLKRRK